MKRISILTAAARRDSARWRAIRVGWTGSGGGVRSRYSNKPSRSRLLGRAVLKHRVRHRSRRQHAGRRHPSWRSAAGQFQSALQGPVAGARHGLFTRSSHPRRGRYRLECGELHRYSDQCREARNLCRALAARGVLYDGRQGSLGDGARRELRLGARRHDLRGKDADHCSQRPGHDDFLARWQIRLCLLVVHARNRCYNRRRPSDRRQDTAGKSILPQHCRDAGQYSGLVYPERYRQDPGLRCAAAL